MIMPDAAREAAGDELAVHRLVVAVLVEVRVVLVEVRRLQRLPADVEVGVGQERLVRRRGVRGVRDEPVDRGVAAGRGAARPWRTRARRRSCCWASRASRSGRCPGSCRSAGRCRAACPGRTRCPARSTGSRSSTRALALVGDGVGQRVRLDEVHDPQVAVLGVALDRHDRVDVLRLVLGQAGRPSPGSRRWRPAPRSHGRAGRRRRLRPAPGWRCPPPASQRLSSWACRPEVACRRRRSRRCGPSRSRSGSCRSWPRRSCRRRMPAPGPPRRSPGSDTAWSRRRGWPRASLPGPPAALPELPELPGRPTRASVVRNRQRAPETTPESIGGDQPLVIIPSRCDGTGRPGSDRPTGTRQESTAQHQITNCERSVNGSVPQTSLLAGRQLIRRETFAGAAEMTRALTTNTQADFSPFQRRLRPR